MVILSSKDRSPKHGSSASLTPDLDGVLDGLAAARAHLAHVLPRVLVLGQADDQRRTVVRRPRTRADLHLMKQVSHFATSFQPLGLPLLYTCRNSGVRLHDVLVHGDPRLGAAPRVDALPHQHKVLCKEWERHSEKILALYYKGYPLFSVVPIPVFPLCLKRTP